MALLDRRRIIATMSSQKSIYKASNALDGVNSHASDKLVERKLTAGTEDRDYTPWIQLDLGAVFTIHEV